jgi:hypothetical protein
MSLAFIARQFRDGIPANPPTSVVEWAERSVKLIGSARSESYRSDITPWTKEPMECANNGTRKVTFIKPIQGGGTSVGEMVILFWLAHWSAGDIQYNWPTGEQANERWNKHTEKKLKACRTVMARLGGGVEWSDGLMVFPHCNFMMQGISAERSLTSDSIRGQVNEEVHTTDHWTPGKLEQAYGRTTAFWNSVVFNISNAAFAGTELHRAFLAGTQQHWEVKCAGCGQYHAMRTRWKESEPEAGGLRYDMEGARVGGEVNYDKLKATIRFQMPCGHTIRDNVAERRALSLSGRYGRPRNPGAPLTDRSYTMEAVSIDYIPWIDLIQKKHSALRAMKLGDPKPFFDYLRERECVFVDPTEDRPLIRSVQRSEQPKNRDGLANRDFRFAALDYQKGSLEHGELPHWWLLIQDVAVELVGNEEIVTFLTVWEGKCLSDEDASGTIKEHKLNPLCVCADSSFASPTVYAFCLKHGYNAVKVAGREAGGVLQKFFKHEDGTQRIYSVPKPLHLMAGQERSRKNSEEEPEFWHISLYGALDRLHYLRNSTSVKWLVPTDVSPDFMSHLESWEQQTRRVQRSNQIVPQWTQVKKRDDLLWCAACIAVQAELAEIIGETSVTYSDSETQASQPIPA